MIDAESTSARGARARAPLGRRAIAARLLLLLLATAGGAQAAGQAAAGEGEPSADADAEAGDDADVDDDSDSAPFMIVVEHMWASDESVYRRCSGALVSLRTVVTSAACARQRDKSPARELWAVAAAAAAGLAPRTDGARRVSRVATAGASSDAAATAWGGAVLDMAVLELERPFGSAARARPILMATAPDECGGSGIVCHVVRTSERSGNRHRARLRIVDAVLAPETKCSPLMRFWNALRDRALCLTGPELCSSDWGAGVVCGGKLCGVVSRSARAAGGAAGAAGPDEPQCGDTHAAQSVARWRLFLHCAHTLRACGRGNCAELCSERRLLENNGLPLNEPPATNVATVAHRIDTTATHRLRPCSSVDLAHLAPPRDDYSGPDDVTMSVNPPTRLQPIVSYEFEDVVSVTTSKVKTARTGPRRTPTRTPRPPVVEEDVNESPIAQPPPPPPRPSSPRPLPPGTQSEPPEQPEPPESPDLPELPALPGVPASFPPPSPAPHLRYTPAIERAPLVRPTPLFESNRPEFKVGDYGEASGDYAPAEEGRRGGGSVYSARRPSAAEASAVEPSVAEPSAVEPSAVEPSDAQRLPRPALEADEANSLLRTPDAPARLAPLATTLKKRRRKIVQEARSGSDRLRVWFRCLLACVPLLYFIF